MISCNKQIDEVREEDLPSACIVGPSTLMFPAFAVDQSYERLLGGRKLTIIMFQLQRRRRDGATAQLLTEWGQTSAFSRVCTLC